MAYGKSIGNGLFQTGFRLLDGSAVNKAFEKMLQGGLSRQDSITAHAGGTKAAAYPLTKSINRISTCATPSDSVLLPKAIAGSVVQLTNAGAKTLAFYGAGTDTIDGADTATASYLYPGESVWLVCLTAGAWTRIASPSVRSTQTLAAAGATQGNAALITGAGGVVIVTVTASTQGVKLPIAVPGMRVEVWADPAVGVKVYPNTGAQIGAGSTNAAVALVKNKAGIYQAVSAAKWRVLQSS